MKRILNIAFAALALAIIGCGTQSGEENASGAKPKVPLDVKMNYSHEVHKSVMEKEGFDCFVCHTVNLEIDPAEEKSAEEMIKASKESFYPGKETCHFCHYNPQAGNIAPGDCSTCHFNMAEIQPKNHNFNWTSKHAVFSKADQESCENCHSPRYCEDCHKRRDFTIVAHDRNFRFIHGIEARANPRQCGNCHQVTFCNTCHTQGGYDY
ncbi:MAG: hypothetical protein RIG61_04500 [Deltaproteobacteria bacterium]